MSKEKSVRVVLMGAAGRMGRAIAARFLHDGKIDLVGAVDPEGAGENVGILAGSENPGPVIEETFDDLPDSVEADLVLDFSMADAVRQNLPKYLKRGWDALIGVTGFNDDDYTKFGKLAEKSSRKVVVVPNFTLGVNLMLRFAREAAKVFEYVEIIEMHHERKADAPSGTALHTAKLIASEKPRPSALTPEDRSRGRIEGDIPIHAVRLPGLLAHQEVIFGSEGEVLTIRHDTTDRSAFLAGIYLAIEKMPELPPGLTRGLDWALE
jgi:4-hydroxy-tetrahydrodipicolinate reductase